MRTLKSKGGFTLVELIVVIAILAILAGVAIPVYNGYIKKAQDASAVTELDAIATAAQAANAVAGSIDEITVEGTTVTVTDAEALASDYDTNFILYMGDNVTAQNSSDKTAVFTVTGLDLSGTSYEEGAKWTRQSGKWIAD